MTWTEFFMQREQYIGLDIELYLDGIVNRGTISDITLDGNNILIHRQVSGHNTGFGWKKETRTDPISINMNVPSAQPREDDRTIKFSLLLLGRATILPKEAGNIDFSRLPTHQPACA